MYEGFKIFSEIDKFFFRSLTFKDNKALEFIILKYDSIKNLVFKQTKNLGYETGLIKFSWYRKNID